MKYQQSLRLADLVDELPKTIQRAIDGDHWFVIVEAARHYYVQVAVEDEWILGEAVSNSYLDRCHQLDERAMSRLEGLGWLGHGEVDRDGDHHRNYFREWELTTPVDEIAVDLIATLVAVYMGGEGDRVELKLGG